MQSLVIMKPQVWGAGLKKPGSLGIVFSAISEPVRVLAAALGLALGAGLTILVAGKKNKLPEITRILE